MTDDNSQFDHMYKDADFEKKARAYMLASTIDMHVKGLSEEEKTIFSDRIMADDEVVALRTDVMTRETMLFDDLPTYLQESADGYTVPTAINPVEFLRIGEAYAVVFENAYGSFETTESNASAAALTDIRDMVSSQVVHESVLESMETSDSKERHYKLKDSKILSAAAKKRAKELFEERARVLGHIDPGEYMTTLYEIYMYTMLAGKKAFYQQAADRLEMIRRKNQAKLIESEIPFLNEAVKLTFEQQLTPAQQERFTAIVRERPMTATLALRDALFIHTSKSLRAIAHYNYEGALQAKMIAFANRVLADDIETPDEKLRIVERIYAIAGLETDESTTELSEIEGQYDLKPMELDWEILPPGETELEKGARQIVEDVVKRSGKASEIDLNRLNILEGVRELWGKDRSYYSRGVRKKRSVVHDMNGHEQPDEYIILVLQEPDAKTGLVREHVVAESPIAGPNALYVYRPDTTDHRHDWRTVMSLPKDRSRLLGARDVKHTTSKQSGNLNDTMIEKVFHLLTVAPAEFSTLEFNGLDKNGNVRIRRSLGRGAGRLVQE